MLNQASISWIARFGLLWLVTGCCQAEDYGVHGETFEIIERDSRLVFMESAARADWNGVNNKFTEKAKNIYKDLPSRSFDQLHDVVIKKLVIKSIATRDIVAPIVVGGAIKWIAVVEKGDEASFSEYFPLNSAILFINFNNYEEIELGKEIIESYDGIMDVVSLSGNPKEYMEEFGKAIYFASDEIMNVYGIEYSPTLIYRSKADKDSVLVSSFPVSYRCEDILKVIQQ